MASGRISRKALDFTAEGVELNRDVLSSLAHELGGIASALDLRAAAMARSIAREDLAALRDIAEEVRMSTRAARFARGSDGSGMLNPTRRQSLEDWWKLTGRFTATVLPRGVLVEPRFTPAHLTADQGSALTWIWLAACKEIAERGLLTPATLVLRGGAEESNTAVALRAELGVDRLPVAEASTSRWSRYAARIGKELGVRATPWERDDSGWRWKCVVRT